MPLVVRPLKETEADQALRIRHVAFDTPGSIGSLFSSDPSPNAYVARKTQGFIDEMRERPTGRYMVVEDTVIQQIISAAHWDIYTRERSVEDVEYICEKSDPPPGAHAQAWNDFFTYESQSRRNLGNRPIAFLYTLVTDPVHQKRGAGRLLMNALVEEVDKLGLEVYLEASEAGRPLYESVGFHAQDERVFNLADYGLQGKESLTVMLRPARNYLEA